MMKAASNVWVKPLGLVRVMEILPAARETGTVALRVSASTKVRVTGVPLNVAVVAEEKPLPRIVMGFRRDRSRV
jgi:hypothetical protein